MAIYDPEFKKLLSVYDLDEWDAQANVICGILPDITFAYFNEEWFEFARQNDGEPAISQNWGLGTSLMSAIADPLKPFYQNAYLKCMNTRETWQHEYECHSPDQYRRFQQFAYPIAAGRGLLLVNALVVEHAHEASPSPLVHSDYVDPAGLVHQCCHCRKVRHGRQVQRWDWVPQWVESPHPKTSHSLCPVCLEYHYPRNAV